MVVDFDAISQNISKHKYTLIGSGSGRHVFDLDNGYVIKVAKNKKGFIQNKAEYQIASKSSSDLFAKIIAISDNSNYLIMKKAEQVDSIAVVWRYFNVNSNQELFRLNIFKDFNMEYKLLFGDLCRKSSWGIIDGKPVIIDYGFTKETRRYYTLF